MFQRIFNQWPRMIILGLLLFGSVYPVFGAGPTVIATGEWAEPAMALVLLIEIAIFASAALLASLLIVGLVAMLLPSMLNLVEWVSFAYCLTGWVAPLRHTLGLPREFDLLISFAAITVMIDLISGRMSRFLPRLNWGPKTARFHVKATPEEVWPRLVPSPATIGQYYQPGALTMPAPEGSGGDFILCIPRRYGYADVGALTRISDCDGPHRATIHVSSVHNQDKFLREITEISIVPVGTGSEVTLRARYERITPGGWLGLTLTNSARDTAQCMRARIEGRRDWSLLGREIRARQKAGSPPSRPATA